jgi:hypothetical protein
MKTVEEARADLTKRFTGDVKRDASEMGLTFPELLKAANGSLQQFVENCGMTIEPGDVSSLMQQFFMEGVMVGVHYERRRTT